ncbi:Positive regulator of CheA protein activity (CheW) [hydrothermal vent metagenome]|uniref:Chemotaxis protein CheW n=1 Tax=hydrothermal vent metagenome TaxID=652676 RepID=A0A3B0Z1R5_9ZZZZ
MNIEEAVNSSGIHGAAEGMNQYLTFIMAEEEYAVDILRVQEIKGWDVATALPNTPDYVRGVINLRGTIVPIIDLRKKFGLDSIEYGATTVVIVLKVISDSGERIMGVVVDAVSEVYNVSPGEMKDAPDFGEVQKEVVKGLATVEDKMIIVLDIDHLLNEPGLQAAIASQPS